MEMDTFKPKIVFVDEDVHTLTSLATQFNATHHVYSVTTATELLDLIMSEQIHVVVCAQRMSTHTGVELLREVRRLSPASTRILLTGYADLAEIVGTLDDDDIYRYITKPWQPDELVHTVEVATRQALEFQIAQSGVYRAVIPIAEKLLVIDDCAETHDLLMMQFSGAYDVLSATNIDQVVALLDKHQFGVIISDIKLNGVDITPLLDTFKERMENTFTIVLTRFQEAERLVELISDGKIYRCLPKPIRASLLEMSVQRAFSQHRKHHRAVESVLENSLEVADERIMRIQHYLAALKQRQIKSRNP